LKSLKKIIARLITIGFILFLTIYFGVFLYYRFAWKSYYSKQLVDSLIANISDTRALTDSFYILYDKAYKDRHERITTRYFKKFWTEFLMVEYPLQNNWQYVTANMQVYKGFRYTRAPMTLAFRINRDVSPEKCFDYIMTARYSKYCKEFKIVDTIMNLNDREQIIKFIIANAKPNYYRIHPTTFKAEMDSLRKVLALN
jgi:hypothetical protein